MSNVRIGWFHLEESFEANGDIDIAIRDKRTGEMIAFKVETLEEYDTLIEYLDENRSVGTLQKLSVASSN